MPRAGEACMQPSSVCAEAPCPYRCSRPCKDQPLYSNCSLGLGLQKIQWCSCFLQAYACRLVRITLLELVSTRTQEYLTGILALLKLTWPHLIDDLHYQHDSLHFQPISWCPATSSIHVLHFQVHSVIFKSVLLISRKNFCCYLTQSTFSSHFLLY